MRSFANTIASVHANSARLRQELDWAGSFIGARNPEDMLRHINVALLESERIHTMLLDFAVRLETHCERRAAGRRNAAFQDVVRASGEHRIAAARKLKAGKVDA